MKAFKNRKIDQTKPVKIYRNLGNQVKERYSVQQKGLIVAHTNELSLENCVFTIRISGRERVRQEERKNVHAFLIGNISEKDLDCTRRVSYNPYNDNGFVCEGEEIKKANYVKITEKGVFV